MGIGRPKKVAGRRELVLERVNDETRDRVGGKELPGGKEGSS